MIEPVLIPPPQASTTLNVGKGLIVTDVVAVDEQVLGAVPVVITTVYVPAIAAVADALTTGSSEDEVKPLGPVQV